MNCGKNTFLLIDLLEIELSLPNYCYISCMFLFSLVESKQNNSAFFKMDFYL